MDASRLLLIAVVALGLGLAIPAAQAQDKDTVSAQWRRTGPPQPMGPAKPWKHVRGFGRVLDLRKPPVVIDEPGLYAIQQNGGSRGDDGVVPELIQITADDVTLDLHGFTVSSRAVQLLYAADDHRRRGEVRNGGLAACCDDGTGTLASTAAAPGFIIFRFYRNETMTFEGEGTSFTDSNIALRLGLRLPTSRPCSAIPSTVIAGGVASGSPASSAM